MKKRISSWTLAVVMLALIMTACGTEGEGTAVSAVQEPAEEDAPSADAVTEITWWAFPNFTQEMPEDSEGTYEQLVIDAFEEGNPDIKVKLVTADFTTGPDRIETAIENGEPCDLLFDAPGRIISYGKRGLLVPLDEMFTEAFLEDVANEEILNSCKDRETAYMYPISTSPFYMAFNRQMAEDAGVSSLIREGFTTEDFTAVITALKEKGFLPGSVFCGGQGGDQGTRAFVANLFDGPITDEAASMYTVNQENGVKALAYIKEAIDTGLLADGTVYNGGDDIQNFANGNTSFTLLWSPAQPETHNILLDISGVETIEVPYPSEDGKPSLEYLINGFCVFDTGEEDKIEASKRLIRFLCDDPVWGPKDVFRTGAFPVRTSYGNLYESTRMMTLSGWKKYYSPYYNTMDGFAEMRFYWTQILQELISGEKTPQAAADEFVKKANAAIHAPIQ